MPSKKDRLKQENLLRKARIILKGGTLRSSSDIDPELENEFLKHALEFEEAPVKPVYEILSINPADFPAENELSDQTLKEKLLQLQKCLTEHRFSLDLQEGLPQRLVYQFLAEDFLYEEITHLPDMTFHINGCDGWCPGCFQADYCKTRDDTWTNEEFEAERRKAQKRKSSKK